jgi:hypothetical protein
MRLFVGRRYISFNRYFGVCRDGKSGHGAFENVERLAAQSSDYVQLGSLPRELRHGSKERERVLAERGDHWTALALFPVFHADLASLLARTHPYA